MSKIVPAILTDNLLDLERKLKKIRGVTDWVQIDIADGRFVNNQSIALEDISKIDGIKDFSLEAHLMVKHPEAYFSACHAMKIKRVIFHIEAVDNVENILTLAEQFSFQKGLALNPKTPIENIKPYRPALDAILLMSVNPGFQGQTFIYNALDKIKALKKIAPKVKVGVDGGVNLSNIKLVSDAGADYIVVGSNLFESKNIKERFEELSRQVEDPR